MIFVCVVLFYWDISWFGCTPIGAFFVLRAFSLQTLRIDPHPLTYFIDQRNVTLWWNFYHGEFVHDVCTVLWAANQLASPFMSWGMTVLNIIARSYCLRGNEGNATWEGIQHSYPYTSKVLEYFSDPRGIGGIGGIPPYILHRYSSCNMEDW